MPIHMNTPMSGFLSGYMTFWILFCMLGLANLFRLNGFEANKSIRKSFYGSSLPAATWAQVQRLYTSHLVLEVEVIAEYPGASGAKTK
jgi:hypothetical protein